jgi:hypothetical protein
MTRRTIIGVLRLEVHSLLWNLPRLEGHTEALPFLCAQPGNAPRLRWKTNLHGPTHDADTLLAKDGAELLPLECGSACHRFVEDVVTEVCDAGFGQRVLQRVRLL